MITLGSRSVQYLLEFKSRLKIENVSIVYQVTLNYPMSDQLKKFLIDSAHNESSKAILECMQSSRHWLKGFVKSSKMLREQKKEKRLTEMKTRQPSLILFEITLQLWQSTWTKSTECTNQLWVRLWTFHVTQILKIAVKSQV